MTKIYVSMITKNEAGRFLPQSLPWMLSFADGVAILDDWSDDNTVPLARSLGARVGIRPERAPGFIDNESQFRQMALRFLETTFEISRNDWVLALDADEFLLADADERKVLEQVIEGCAEIDAVKFPVAEVFGWEDQPMIRTDGFWGQIEATRLYRYSPGARFEDRELAGGSVPSRLNRVHRSDDLTILHFGYATAEDRTVKHMRYAGRGGHSASHVASITQPPMLRAWGGKVPLDGK